MRYLLLIVYTIFLVGGKQAIAQTPVSTKEEAEKTWRILKSHKPDIEKVNLQLALAKWVVADRAQPSATIDTARSLATEAYQLSKGLQYQEGEAKSSLQLSVIAQINHNYDEGKAF